MDYNFDFNAVPLFDMQDFFSREIKTRNLFVKKLQDACHHVGFFYLKNHGVDKKLMRNILELTNSFFNLSQVEKDAINIAHSPHYRGYGKLCAEMTEGKPDFKETYDLGLEHPPAMVTSEKPYLILRGPNQWPSLTSFKETVLQYLVAMQTLGESIMKAMSLTLGLSEDFFAKHFCQNAPDSYAILRMLRYPPGRVGNDNQDPEIGVGTHIDMGCLVFLLQDEVGGLQVQNRSSQWVDAPPIPDTFVVNIGAMLQVWSNNYFLATPHRVVNTTSKIRHSVPFFFEPNLSTVVTPIHQSSSKTKVIYGEHMLDIYQRSFPVERK